MILKTKIALIGNLPHDLMGYYGKSKTANFLMMYHRAAYSLHAVREFNLVHHTIFKSPWLNTYSDVARKILSCISLSRMSTNTIHSGLSYFARISDKSKMYFREYHDGSTFTICFIDYVSSVSDYERQLTNCLKE